VEEEKMDVGTMISDLRSEAERISRAIAALAGLGTSGPGRKRGTTASRKGPSKKRKRGGLTAAGRKRLSMLMKKRWAERKQKGSKKL
jgi:hypothetical protein